MNYQAELDRWLERAGEDPAGCGALSAREPTG